MVLECLTDAGFPAVLDAEGKGNEAVHVSAIRIPKAGFDPGRDNPALQTAEELFLPVHPCDQCHVGIVERRYLRQEVRARSENSRVRGNVRPNGAISRSRTAASGSVASMPSSSRM
jgi:hypothetical protein